MEKPFVQLGKPFILHLHTSAKESLKKKEWIVMD